MSIDRSHEPRRPLIDPAGIEQAVRDWVGRIATHLKRAADTSIDWEDGELRNDGPNRPRGR